MTSDLLSFITADSNAGDPITLDNGLIWYPHLGIGYLHFKDGAEQIYDRDYFNKYVGYKGSPIATLLNAERVSLVRDFLTDHHMVLDVGIGSGEFIEERNKGLDYYNRATYGTDINPAGVEWLKDHRLYIPSEELNNPLSLFKGITFWDSLEHIPDPSFIKNYKFAFISCPIYNDLAHVLSSKHFRPNEHCWYWTAPGLVHFMGKLGFTLMTFDAREVKCGREDILSFVFRNNAEV